MPKPETDRLEQAVQTVARRLDLGGWISVASAMVWLPQAACVAWLLAALLAGTGSLQATLTAVGGFVLLGALRAILQEGSDRILTEAADRVLALEREMLVLREGRRSPVAPAPRSAEVAALAGEKLAMLQPFLTRYRPARLRAIVVPVVILAAAAWYSWIVALILLVAGPLIPVFMALVGMAAQEASERQMDEIGSLNSLLMERLQALLDIRLLDARGRIITEFETRADALRARTMDVLRIAFLSSTVLELFAALGVAMVAVYVGFALLGTITFGAWATPLTAAEGVFLLLLAPEFFQPLRDLASAWHDRASARAVAQDLGAIESADRVDMLGLDAAASGRPETGRHGTGNVHASMGGVDVTGLAVKLGEGKEMRFPDFRIGYGECVALVGASGRGKTTLLAILAGLVPPSRGHVRIDGEELDEATASGWRRRIGWASQAPHFFSTSLLENLRRAAPDATAGEMSDALRLARAEEMVARLPRGLLTRLGETGTGVSGGEARRLMLARAALCRREVILADEPTANLDADTARAVSDGLLALAAEGATLVVATHDRDLAARMDRQISLDAQS